METNKLFIDSSTNYLFISLVKGNEVMSKLSLLGSNNHSEVLIQTVKQELDKNKITIDEIDEIYVGKGPGSYTGGRVACTFAKVLAYSKKKKLYSVSSLDLRYSASVENKTTIVMFDARRGNSYAKVWKNDEKLELIEKELFTPTNYLTEKYPDAFVLTQDEFDANPKWILENKLYQEETNIHDFVPTYLRNGVQ